jgi:hypothetical protein
MPLGFLPLPARSLLRTLTAVALLGTAPGVLGQEAPEKNPFADADSHPAYQARCDEVRALTKGRETGTDRIDFSATGPLAMVHFDGTLAYLGLCGEGADPKVLCVTYSTNDMKVGEVVVITGGYSRPNPDFIILDPCLAQRPASP